MSCYGASEQCRRSFGLLDQGVGIVGVPCQVAVPGEQVLEPSSHHGVDAAAEVRHQFIDG